MKLQNQSLITFTVNRFQKNSALMNNSLDKLSSGLQIRKASDNASGIAISETMSAQIRGISQAQRNMQDGLSVLDAADGGLNHVASLLQRARELSVMNANETLTLEDRQAGQLELEQIMQSINDTSEKLEFNTMKILGENAPLVLMVGANPQQKISIDLMDIGTDALGLTNASILTQPDAETLISKVNDAISKVSLDLTKIGSYYEAVEHHLTNALQYESNLTSSVSKLKDTDMAKEMMNYLSLNIRQNSNQILVSHVNQQSQDVMKLLS